MCLVSGDLDHEGAVATSDFEVSRLVWRRGEVKQCRPGFLGSILVLERWRWGENMAVVFNKRDGGGENTWLFVFISYYCYHEACTSASCL